MLFCDGSCGPANPSGIGGWAYIITEDNEEDSIGSGKLEAGLGNNYAEFYGLYKGLSYISKLFYFSEDKRIQLFIRSDSQLLINIIKKRWKASPDKLYYPAAELVFKKLRELKDKGIVIFVDWIPREENTHADSLSKYQNFIN